MILMVTVFLLFNYIAADGAPLHCWLLYVTALRCLNGPTLYSPLLGTGLRTRQKSKPAEKHGKV